MATPKDDSLQVGNYKQFTQVNEYSKEEGLVVMGCADGSPVIVRAVKPYGMRKQSWTATKERTPPVFPAPAPDDANSTLVGKVYSVPMPQPTTGPNPYYTFQMSGNFLYVEDSPTDEVSGFPGAKVPFKYPALASFASQEFQRNALGGVVGGAGLAALLTITPRFNEGAYTWPFTHISTGFADSTLSESWAVDTAGSRSYSIDTLGRG